MADRKDWKVLLLLNNSNARNDSFVRSWRGVSALASRPKQAKKKKKNKLELLNKWSLDSSKHSTVSLLGAFSLFCLSRSSKSTVVKLKGETKLFCYKHCTSLPPLTVRGTAITLLYKPLSLRLVLGTHVQLLFFFFAFHFVCVKAEVLCH